jgi:hypothetical protein
VIERSAVRTPFTLPDQIAAHSDSVLSEIDIKISHGNLLLPLIASRLFVAIE